MKYKFLLTVLTCLIISLKSVENHSCLNWSQWNDYKSNYSIQFYNSTLELIA